MRKQLIVILIGMILLVSAWVGTVSAQDVPGYPVETEIPTKPPENTPPPSTPEPTQPQPNPTEAPPTWVPPLPTPTPSATPNVTLEGCPFTRVHPMLAILAVRFDVSFEELADMFCSSHMGIGEIIQYLEGLHQSNGGPVDYPANFPEGAGHGWGLFWHIFNRIGFPGNRSWAAPS